MIHFKQLEGTAPSAIQMIDAKGNAQKPVSSLSQKNQLSKATELVMTPYHYLIPATPL